MRRTTWLLGLLATLATGPLAAQEQILSKDQILRQLLGGGTRAIGKRQRASLALPTVTFEFDSATLTAQGRRQLDELAGALKEGHLANRRITIGGHTDAVGSEAYNQRLSEERAASARDYLIQEHKLSADQLATAGFGEGKPLADQPTTAAGQRRVEFGIELTS